MVNLSFVPPSATTAARCVPAARTCGPATLTHRVAGAAPRGRALLARASVPRPHH